jgi:hypothetical protein
LLPVTELHKLAAAGDWAAVRDYKAIADRPGDMLSGLAYGPLVSNSLFSVEGHLVRATFNG